MDFSLPETWVLGATSEYFVDTTEKIKGTRVFVPRKYFTTFMNKIHSYPYLMFKIQAIGTEHGFGEIIVCLAGGHQEDSNVIIVPDWIISYIGASNGGLCTIKFLTETCPEPVRHIECSIEITRQFQEDLGIDIRTAVENELSDLQLLTEEMPFEFSLPELDTQISGKIIGLKTNDSDIFSGYIEPNSEVSVNFIFLPDSVPVVPPKPVAVFQPELQPELQPKLQPEPQPQPLTAEQRSKLVRESWIKLSL